MAVERLPFEFLNEVGEASRGRVQIRVIDLIGIARHDNLGALAYARDDRFHFVRREILGIVNNDKLVRQTATAQESDGCDNYSSRIEKHLKLMASVALLCI